MTTTHRRAGLPPADLRARWQAGSLASVWLRPGDWYHAAVDALVEAVVDGDDTGPAAERLGQARAAAGVGMGETIDDLLCLVAALGETPTAHGRTEARGRQDGGDGTVEHRVEAVALVRAACEGWAAEHASAPVLAHCIDPDSGLPTAEYLGVRLGETYGRAERSGQIVGDTHALLVTDVDAGDLAPWSQIVRSAVVGEGLTLVFGDGHPMAALGRGVFAVLVERTADLGAQALSLRDRLLEHAQSHGAQDLIRQPPRVWVESLPASRLQAVELLGHLGR